MTDFAKSLLFENKLQEKFQPDIGTMDQFKSGRQIYDRPGPPLESEVELSSIENIVDMPLTADDMMSTQLTSVKISRKRLSSPDYEPKNNKELNTAISSLMSDIELGEKDVKVLWHGIRKFLNKKA